MNGNLPSPPSFWRTVRLLLGATRKRSGGRQKRQRQLLQHRSGTDWGVLGFAVSVLFMALLNVFAAFVLRSAVTSGQRADAENQGKIVVSSSFLDAAKQVSPPDDDASNIADQVLPEYQYSSEARNIAREYGGRADDIEVKLRNAVRKHGARDFILAVRGQLAHGFEGFFQELGHK